MTTVHPEPVRKWFEAGCPLMTQADVDASLRRAHRCHSSAHAHAAGCLVEISAKRHEDGRSLTTRLLLPTAERLLAELGEAVRQASAAQAAQDATYRDHPWELEVAG